MRWEVRVVGELGERANSKHSPPTPRARKWKWWWKINRVCKNRSHFKGTFQAKRSSAEKTHYFLLTNIKYANTLMWWKIINYGKFETLPTTHPLPLHVPREDKNFVIFRLLQICSFSLPSTSFLWMGAEFFICISLVWTFFGQKSRDLWANTWSEFELWMCMHISQVIFSKSFRS